MADLLALPRGPRHGWPVLLADPPWSFRDQASRVAPAFASEDRRARYEVMSLQAILDMGREVRDVVRIDSFLFLWAPNALVVDGTASSVARAWGFVPKQLIPWVKTTADGRPRIGAGHFTRVCTEQLLLCRRGKATVRDRGVPGVVHAPRGEHSAKPDASYELIERLASGPYLELFARRQFGPAWTCWGNEAPSQADRELDSSVQLEVP